MNKVASYKEIIYKEAGVIGGGLAGIVLGAAGGAALGHGAASARNNLTFDKERKQLHKDKKISKKQLRSTRGEFYNFEEGVEDGIRKEFNSYMSSLSPKERSEVTVGEIESMLKAKALSMSKTASSKTVKAMAVTGIPVAAITAYDQYRIDTNKDKMRHAISRRQEEMKDLKDTMSGKKKYNANTNLLSYMNTKSDYIEMDKEDAEYLTNRVHKRLESHGVDPKKVRYNDYKNIYNDITTQYDGLNLDEVENKAIKKYLSKVAASEHLDELVKKASEKWTKQDKKGYLRNVAISTVQDFVNAGNPLNIGSSMVGSVLDSALLEKGSMNLNKKAQRDKMAQNKLKNFNKAVDVKNGIAIPHAIDNKVNK